MTIHRDASMYQEIPEGTWTLCFGWFMHPLFKMRYGFPLHSALRPLFVSFHCNKRELLTDDAIAYLKRYGPVGCRDWTTVYLLLSAGVPAFFSGCMTTTVSTVFPEADARPDASAPVGYVDVLDGSVPAGAPTYQHSDRAVRRRSFLENCDDAVDRLETYRRDLSKVVTSRLHAYLPLRSLGVPVDFKPGQHVRHPLRRPRRDHRRGVLLDAGRHHRAARGDVHADPVRRERGRGLRPLARADRRQGGRGRGPAARAGRHPHRPAAARRGGRDRGRRDRARRPGHPARRRRGGALRGLRDEVRRAPARAPGALAGHPLLAPAAPVAAGPSQGGADPAHAGPGLPRGDLQLGAHRRARRRAPPARPHPQLGGPAGAARPAARRAAGRGAARGDRRRRRRGGAGRRSTSAGTRSRPPGRARTSPAASR